MRLEDFPDPKPTWLVAENDGRVVSWHYDEESAEADHDGDPDRYVRHVQHVNSGYNDWE